MQYYIVYYIYNNYCTAALYNIVLRESEIKIRSILHDNIQVTMNFRVLILLETMYIFFQGRPFKIPPSARDDKVSKKKRKRKLEEDSLVNEKLISIAEFCRLACEYNRTKPWFI